MGVLAKDVASMFGRCNKKLSQPDKRTKVGCVWCRSCALFHNWQLRDKMNTEKFNSLDALTAVLTDNTRTNTV